MAALILLFASPSHAQIVQQVIATTHPLGGMSGWSYQQDVFMPCTAGTASCTTTGNTEVVAPTTSGSIRVIVMENGNSNIHITSITGGSGETWVHCASCQVFNSGHDAMDAYYSLGGAGGLTAYTVAVSGNFVANADFEFIEFMPPPGFTASFDTAGSNTQASCTTCTGVGLTLGGTDAVLEMFDTANMSGPTATSWNMWSSPFISNVNNDGIGINLPSGSLTAPTFTQTSASFNTSIAIAFTSTAGSFSVSPAPIWTIANYSEPNLVSSSLTTCNTSCSITITQPTAGNLLFLNFSTSLNGVTISSVSDAVNGSWVVPTGCQASVNVGQASSIACAYVTSAASGVYTTVNITLNTSASSAFSVYEGHRTSGTTALDAIGSAARAVGTEPYPPGITFSSLSGTNDICFQVGGLVGGVSGDTVYPYQGGSHSPGFGGSNGLASGQAVALLNTTNVNGPVWAYPGEGSNQVPVYGVCFK